MRSLLIALLAFITTNATSQQPKEILKRYFNEVLNERKVEVISELFAENYELHTLTHNEHLKVTAEGLKKFITELLAAVPDLKYTIGDAFQEGDKGVIRVRLNGTHKGELFGYPASGNKIDLSEVFFCRVKDGKIVDFSTQIDWYHLFKQLQK